MRKGVSHMFGKSWTIVMWSFLTIDFTGLRFNRYGNVIWRFTLPNV